MVTLQNDTTYAFKGKRLEQLHYTLLAANPLEASSSPSGEVFKRKVKK